MNIAYLIAAHTDPKQLKKLVMALDNGKNDFYIHIDKKSDKQPFVQMLEDIKRVKFTRKRISDYWGGFSHMLTLETLLEEALKNKHDRLVYISGLDYPVWSNDEIEQYYQKNQSKQLVCGFNLTKGNDKNAIQKISHYAWWDVPIKHEKAFNKIRRKLNDLLMYVPHPTSFKIDGKEWDVYWGSDWWSMTYDCAKEVFSIYRSHPEIKKFFKFTFCPSELWIQTILANSTYREEMQIISEYDFSKVTVLQHIRYTSSMYVWTENEFEEIIQSEKMFIRKTMSGVSDGLCQKLDEYRNNRE